MHEDVSACLHVVLPADRLEGVRGERLNGATAAGRGELEPAAQRGRHPNAQHHQPLLAICALRRTDARLRSTMLGGQRRGRMRPVGLAGAQTRPWFTHGRTPF